MRNPIIDAADDHLTPQEKQVEKALRPKGLTEFAGQEDIVENLFVFIQAAKQRAGPCSSAWSPRLRKNNAFAHYCD
jgi:holliday junction DNA helicase RuvB